MNSEAYLRLPRWVRPIRWCLCRVLDKLTDPFMRPWPWLGRYQECPTAATIWLYIHVFPRFLQDQDD